MNETLGDIKDGLDTASGVRTILLTDEEREAIIFALCFIETNERQAQAAFDENR